MDYPSNSKNSQAKDEKVEEPKKVDKVVVGEVVRRKKSLGKRLGETFVKGEAKSVWSYVAFDVLIPAAKDMVADAVSQGAERMLFGETRGRKRPGATSGMNGYVSYNRFAPSSSQPKQTREERPVSKRGRATHDFDEIILATRAEGQEVIDRLFDLLNRYESASVTDLYELVGVTGNYTDDKWGWTDLRGSGVVQVRGGYLLDLPKPEPLD